MIQSSYIPMGGLRSSDTVRYTPKRVTDLALELGAHPTCVELDFEEACSQCSALVHAALDTIYGHAANSTEALMMIINDILDDKDPLTQ